VEVYFRTGLEDSTQQFTAVDVFDLENSKRYRRKYFISASLLQAVAE